MLYKATGIVLAGGKSSRMGRDKALLKIEDKTILYRSVEKLSRLFEEVMVVADRPGKYPIAGISEAVDIYPERGPLGGIHAGLNAAAYERAFVTACDMPFWDAKAVRVLMEQGADLDAVMLRSGSRPEPLFAVYHRRCLPVFEECLAKNHLKMRDIFQMLRVGYVDAESYKEDGISTGILTNINTPEEYFKFTGRKPDDV